MHLQNLRKKSILLLTISILFLSIIHAPPAYSSTTFSGSATKESTDDASTTPSVAAYGTNVYIAYVDSGGLVQVLTSTNSGTSFPTMNQLTTDGGTDSSPQIIANGTNVYVGFTDASGNIQFSASTDSGSTFSALVPITSDAGTDPFHLALYHNNVYIAYTDGTNLKVKTSTDKGTSFPTTNTLSTHGTPSDSQIVANSTNVFVVWKNSTNNIGFRASTNSGTSFAATKVLTNDASSTVPQIGIAGNNAYVIWEDSRTDSVHHEINFTSSSDSGNTFGGYTNLSNNSGDSKNPRVVANGTNVFVAWQDTQPGNKEILFKKSINNGAFFSNAVNLSNNAQNSQVPQIKLLNDNVYVAWQDTSFSTGSGVDILFVSITNSGTTVSSVSNLSGATTTDDTASNQQIAAFGNNAYVTWEDDLSDGTTTNVYFIAGTKSSVNIQFDASQYKLSDTATITVTDASANTQAGSVDTISVKVNSTSDGTGFTKTFTETGANTGIFTGQITFGSSTTSGSSVIKAVAGDTITATYSGQRSTAGIFLTQIQFDASTHDYGDTAHLTITDQSKNQNSNVAETITAQLTSNANPSSVSITLTETGVNTGIFGSSSTDKIIFLVGNNLWPVPSSVTISQTDSSTNTATESDTITSSSSETTTIVLTQAGTTHVFSGKLQITSGSTVNPGTLHASPGDIITVTGQGGMKTNALVTPNGVASTAAIQVTGNTADTVKASFNGATATLTVNNGFGSGGGGGGLVRPGLVLDIIAGISGSDSYVPPSLSLNNMAQSPGLLPDNIRQQVLNADPFKPIAPSDDKSFDFPFSIDGGGYVLAGLTNTIQTVTEKTGVPTDIKLNIPSTGLQHIALYTNMKGVDLSPEKSDTYIIYDKGQPLKIVDPHGLFTKVTFDLSTVGIKNTIDYKITFAKPMETSGIYLRTWNDHAASADNKILNALQVIESPSSTSPSQSPPIITPPTETPNIQNVAPIIQNQNSEDIPQSIKDWGGYSPNPISDAELLHDLGMNAQHIPSWFMKTSKLFVNGDISEDEFVSAIKYMYSNGIIK